MITDETQIRNIKQVILRILKNQKIYPFVDKSRINQFERDVSVDTCNALWGLTHINCNNISFPFYHDFHIADSFFNDILQRHGMYGIGLFDEYNKYKNNNRAIYDLELKKYTKIFDQNK